MGLIEDLMEAQLRLAHAIDAVTARLEAVEQHEVLDREYYMLSELPAIKGIGQSKLEHDRYLQPLGGAGRLRIGGRLKWHRSIIAEWLMQDDDTLLALYGPQSKKRGGEAA